MELDFLSDAWVAAFVERLKESDKYKKAAKSWKWSMAFALLPEDGKDVEACGVVLDLNQGEVRSATRVPGKGPYEADFVIRGVGDNWRRLLTKEIFPAPALMSGQLQLVKGSTSTLMMNMGGAQALLDEAGGLPTRYPG